MKSIFLVILLFVIFTGFSSCIELGIFGTFNYNDIPNKTENEYSGSVSGSVYINVTTIKITFDVHLNNYEGSNSTFSKIIFNGNSSNSLLPNIDLPCINTGNESVITCTATQTYLLSNKTEFNQWLDILQNAYIDPFKYGFIYIDAYFSNQSDTRALLSLFYLAPCSYDIPGVKTVGLFGTFGNSTLIDGQTPILLTGYANGYIHYNDTYFNMTMYIQVKHKIVNYDFKLFGIAKSKQPATSINGTSFTFPYPNSGLPLNTSFINTGYYLHSGTDIEDYIELVEKSLSNPYEYGGFYIQFSEPAAFKKSRAQLRTYIPMKKFQVPECDITKYIISTTSYTSVTTVFSEVLSQGYSITPSHIIYLAIVLILCTLM